jgi:hypothetical protein
LYAIVLEITLKTALNHLRRDISLGKIDLADTRQPLCVSARFSLSSKVAVDKGMRNVPARAMVEESHRL